MQYIVPFLKNHFSYSGFAIAVNRCCRIDTGEKLHHFQTSYGTAVEAI
jgi:hypothetical protein